MNFPRATLTLLLGAISLPILICVLLGTGQLLKVMDDAAGAAVLARLSLAAGILWAIDLIGLVLVLAIQACARSDEPRDEL